MSLDESNVSRVSPAHPDDEPSLGERLRTAREAQPLSLAQISAALRIEVRLLTALEEDRLDVFAAPVFTKGYLRQYGTLLGLDERDLLAQYYRQVDTRDVPFVQHKPIRLRDEDQIRHWIAAAVVLVVILVGVAVWWTRQPVIQAPVEPLLDEPARTTTGAPSDGPQPVPTATPPPVIGTAAAPIAMSDRPVGPVLTPPPTTAPAPLDAGDLIAVEISFAEDCWTEISDARGERLFYGLGSAGARSRFNASLPLSIFLGNASGVELTVDGERYPIPAGSRQGNLARFVIADLTP